MYLKIFSLKIFINENQLLKSQMENYFQIKNCMKKKFPMAVLGHHRTLYSHCRILEHKSKIGQQKMEYLMVNRSEGFPSSVSEEFKGCTKMSRICFRCGKEE